MRLPGTSPASPDDVGDAHPGLAAALASGDSTAIASCLLACRLLVPVVAMPGEGDADMAVPALVAPDGRRALPVFSSYDALRAWQPDARPVPMPGLRVMAGAGAEGYDGVVIDVAGPVSHTITGDELATLAAAAAALAANPAAAIRIVQP
jgi:hypothetical protein